MMHSSKDHTFLTPKVFAKDHISIAPGFGYLTIKAIIYLPNSTEELGIKLA